LTSKYFHEYKHQEHKDKFIANSLLFKWDGEGFQYINIGVHGFKGSGFSPPQEWRIKVQNSRLTALRFFPYPLISLG
jgi:hypothetical protein